MTQWAAGMLAALFVVQTWRLASAGYGWLVNGVSAAMLLGGWWLSRGHVGFLLASAILAVFAIAVSAIPQIRNARYGRYLQESLQACAVIMAVLGLFDIQASLLPVSDPQFLPRLVQSLAAAALVGVITDAMMLGHWYLIDPKLPKRAINRLNIIAAGTLGAYVVAVGLFSLWLGTGLAGGNEIFVGAWLALAVFLAVLLFLVRGALKVKGYASVMSATGLYYVATMLAFGSVVLGQYLSAS